MAVVAEYKAREEELIQHVKYAVERAERFGRYDERRKVQDQLSSYQSKIDHLHAELAAANRRYDKLVEESDAKSFEHRVQVRKVRDRLEREKTRSRFFRIQVRDEFYSELQRREKVAFRSSRCIPT